MFTAAATFLVRNVCHLVYFFSLYRWSELIRKIEMWVEIQELNDQGEYCPVECTSKPDPGTGGTFQIRQVMAPQLLPPSGLVVVGGYSVGTTFSARGCCQLFCLSKFQTCIIIECKVIVIAGIKAP